MSASKKRGLGRGLGALIPPAPTDEDRVMGSLAGTSEGDEASEHESTEGVETPENVVKVVHVKTSVGSLTQETASPIDVFFNPSVTRDLAASESSHTTERSIEGRNREQAWGAALSDGRLSIHGENRAKTTMAVQTQPAVLQSGNELLPVPGARFAELDITAIQPNAMQPRTVFDEDQLDELKASISEIGVLQPIVVRPLPEKSGHYELIMGERRWRASQAAGLTTVPAIIRETDDSNMLRDALLENLHRADLNPLEEAAAYRQLLDDFGCTHDELASRIARSRPQISNTLRLLKLPPLVQRRVAAGILSAGHARALLSLNDAGEMERLAQKIVAEGLSVRAVEELVAVSNSGDGKQSRRRTANGTTDSEETRELASKLSDKFDTRVKVVIGKNKGHVTVEFATRDDLNRILTLMGSDIPHVSY